MKWVDWNKGVEKLVRKCRTQVPVAYYKIGIMMSFISLASISLRLSLIAGLRTLFEYET